ncbi:MAG: hypothetical protein U9N56_11895 [Actinomycetota bacterium]|nr:hypothetical protein [Actinomycetota bacterium]
MNIASAFRSPAVQRGALAVIAVIAILAIPDFRGALVRFLVAAGAGAYGALELITGVKDRRWSQAAIAVVFILTGVALLFGGDDAR